MAKPEEILKLARESKGYTQQTLAERLGISSRMVQRYEEGVFPKYKSDNIKKIDDLLETKLYDILYDISVLHEPVINYMGNTNGNGNGDKDKIISIQERELAGKEREIKRLEDQVADLKAQLETLRELKKTVTDFNSALKENLEDIHESVKLNQAEVLTVADCLKAHRSKLEKGETVAKLDAEANKFLDANVRKILKIE